MPPAAAVWGMLTELLEVELEVELPAAAEPVADVDDVDEDMMEEGWRRQRTQLGRRRARKHRKGKPPMSSCDRRDICVTS